VVLGIAGHSLGGLYRVRFGWRLGLVERSRIKAALALSPHCSPFVAKGDLGTMDVPVMYQGGRRDWASRRWCGSRAGRTTRRLSQNFMWSFEGAGHFAWTNFKSKVSDVYRRIRSGVF